MFVNVSVSIIYKDFCLCVSHNMPVYAICKIILTENIILNDAKNNQSSIMHTPVHSNGDRSWLSSLLHSSVSHAIACSLSMSLLLTIPLVFTSVSRLSSNPIKTSG